MHKRINAPERILTVLFQGISAEINPRRIRPMPDYVWRAASGTGKIAEGQLSAISEAAALKQLREQARSALRQRSVQCEIAACTPRSISPTLIHLLARSTLFAVRHGMARFDLRS